MQPRALALWTLGLVFAALLLVSAAARAAEPGDANCDGTVDEEDLRALAERIFAPGDCDQVDPNGDGATSAPDLLAQGERVVHAGAPTETPVPPATETPTPPLGPAITFFGIVASSGSRIPVSEFTDAGIPIVNRAAAIGFKIVVEAVPGITGANVGQTLMNSKPGDPTALPDLQIESSRDLGNGSVAVCAGGVPGVDPPRFATEQYVADAMNDFACRFSVATIKGATCTIDDFENPSFASPESRIQFCRQIASAEGFGPGDTLLTVRLRDRIGNYGPTAQLIVRLPGAAPTGTPTQSGTPTLPPTSTRTPTVTQTVPRTATRTRTATFTATRVPPSPTSTATRTATALFTATTVAATPATAPPTATVTPTSSGPTGTPTATSAVSTATRTSTPTRTATGSTVLTSTFTATRPTATLTPTQPPASFTRTPTRTATVAAGTATATQTRTRTVTPTGTPTRAGSNGPVITFLGLVRADNRYNPADLVGTTPEGIPIYHRSLGTGFVIVVEGRPGLPSRRPVGTNSFNSDPGDPTVLPDIQIQVNRNLGDGSLDVCDNEAPQLGGVPGINPPRFDATQPIANAMNDLGCRFVDGTGQPMARNAQSACVLFDDGEFGFLGTGTTAQYCSAVIPQALKFPAGDTLVSVRLRDDRGNLSPVSQLFVRVGN